LLSLLPSMSPTIPCTFLTLPPPTPRRTSLCPSTTLFRSSVPGPITWIAARLGSSRGSSEAPGRGEITPSRRTSSRSSTVSPAARSEEHTSELQSRFDLVCRLPLEKKKDTAQTSTHLVHS